MPLKLSEVMRPAATSSETACVSSLGVVTARRRSWKKHAPVWRKRSSTWRATAESSSCGSAGSASQDQLSRSASTIGVVASERKSFAPLGARARPHTSCPDKHKPSSQLGS
jgi:hypothetical protein